MYLWSDYLCWGVQPPLYFTQGCQLQHIFASLSSSKWSPGLEIMMPAEKCRTRWLHCSMWPSLSFFFVRLRGEKVMSKWMTFSWDNCIPLWTILISVQNISGLSAVASTFLSHWKYSGLFLELHTRDWAWGHMPCHLVVGQVWQCQGHFFLLNKFQCVHWCTCERKDRNVILTVVGLDTLHLCGRLQCGSQAALQKLSLALSFLWLMCFKHHHCQITFSRGSREIAGLCSQLSIPDR